MRKLTRHLSVNKQQKGFFKAHAFALSWALIVMVLCVVPADTLPPLDFWELNLEDKVAHMGVFALLAVLMVYGEQRRLGLRRLPAKNVVVIMATGILYGVLTEFIQGSLIPTRYASIGDVLADSIGSVLGTIVAPGLLKITGISKA